MVSVPTTAPIIAAELELGDVIAENGITYTIEGITEMPSRALVVTTNLRSGARGRTFNFRPGTEVEVILP